jgi:hypothetical protein
VPELDRDVVSRVGGVPSFNRVVTQRRDELLGGILRGRMSQENVELVRQAIDAWDRRDYTAWFALHDPNYDVVSSRFLPETEVVRGREPAWEFYLSNQNTSATGVRFGAALGSGLSFP